MPDAGKNPRIEGDESVVPELAARCRREFTDLPGMRLTERQARRLLSTDSTTCHAALERLVASGFLRRSEEIYMRAEPRTRES
jgi:hypothetical protein